MNALPRETAGKVPFEPWKLEGKVVLLTFIATWCFPCLTELVVVNRLERDHKDQGFANVLIGMDLEGRAVLEPFAEGYNLKVPLIVGDDRIRSGETVFGRIRELPSRILFGRGRRAGRRLLRGREIRRPRTPGGVRGLEEAPSCSLSPGRGSG